MSNVVIELHYLPCLAYFTILQRYGAVVLEKHEHFVKQSYRNRCYVNTEHGPEALSVPLTGKHGKVPVTRVRVDYTQKWLNNHWRTIQSAYGKAPFFEFYSDDLHDVLFRKYDYLYDLNYALLTMCLTWLRCDIKVRESLSYEKEYAQGFHDLRSCITPRNPEFVQRIHRAVPYCQVFGSTFADNLSILDVVFCSGPEAGRILKLRGERE